MSEVVASDDCISRSLIFPTFFNERNVHIDSKLWQFGKTLADGSAHLSAILRRLAPSLEDVHKIGCDIASGQNVKTLASGRVSDRRYYCGCRTARVGDLPLVGPGYSVTLTNDGEGGVPSHVDVALLIDPNLTRSAKAQTRTNAGIALAERFGAADPHRCICDAGDENHPFSKGYQLDSHDDVPPFAENENATARLRTNIEQV